MVSNPATEPEVEMAYVDWMIKGNKVSSCNCNYGCPCEFYAPPTYGKCEGAEAMQIDEGHFGGIRLDGLRLALLTGWPGAIHEGDGVGQVIIDERADDAQRDALYKIASGDEQDPGTAFSIYASTMNEDYAALYKPIDMACDMEARTGHIRVDGIIDIEVEPILNPVTQQPHRVRLVLPQGFEFRDAEIASGSCSSSGDLNIDYQNRHAVFTEFAYGPHGVIA